MDLNFTAEEQAFRAEIRQWVADNLPQDISAKVHGALRLQKSDLQRWAQILGKKGWHGWAWPKQFGGPGWNAVQRHLFEEECALAGAPRVIPFGPVMVAPVIMAFGTPEQQERHLPGIMSGEVWWSQGYSEPGSGSDLASVKCKAERQGDKYIVNGQKTWTTLGQYGDWIFCLVRTDSSGKPQTGHAAGCIQFGMAVGQHGLHQLKASDRLAELLAFDSVGQCVLEHAFSHANT